MLIERPDPYSLNVAGVLTPTLAGSLIYMNQNGYLLVNTKCYPLAYVKLLYRQHTSHCQRALVVLFLLLEGLLAYGGNTAGEYLLEQL